MIPAFIISKVVKMALKGAISEKLVKTLILKLIEVLVKSTKNDLDDKAWEQVKKILK